MQTPSTTARTPRFAASLRGLHPNLAYLSCSTPDCSQLHSVRRALAGAHRHSRPARAHRAHATRMGRAPTRMGRAPRLTYVLDMSEVTDGTHIPLRRQGSRDRASYANRPVGKGAFLAGEKIALRVLLQPRFSCLERQSRIAPSIGPLRRRALLLSSGPYPVSSIPNCCFDGAERSLAEMVAQSWDDVLHRHLVHGRQSAGNAQSEMPRPIP